MAKPVLGRGLGELLNGNRTHGTHADTETRTSSPPRLSAGLSTLVRSPAEQSTSAIRFPSLTVLRTSLLAADMALTIGAILHFLSRPGTDWTTTVIALLMVTFGAWLGWLGLTWARDAR